LYGPPGCSKSSIAKAAAQTAGISFLTASIAQVYSPYFGVAEEAIRQIFHRARAAVPAIIFFDEIDTLVGKREFDASGEQRGSQISIRLLSTLLNEMDGVESSTGMVNFLKHLASYLLIIYRSRSNWCYKSSRKHRCCFIETWSF
jgi:transitional endoplasmic reticulum ATPase